jgi:hypothetical protein
MKKYGLVTVDGADTLKRKMNVLKLHLSTPKEKAR